MSKQPIVYLDSLDDRREIWQLLERIPPWRRIAWLQWCCDHCKIPRGKCRPRVQAKTIGTVMEIYYDWWMLITVYQCDDEASYRTFLDALVRVVRKWEGHVPRKVYTGGFGEI